MIELSWPPKQLNPNHTGKLRLKMRAQKLYREEAQGATQAALGSAYRAPAHTEIPLIVTFYPPDRQRRDRDNMIAAFKRGQDGIALAMHADDHWFRPTYHFAEPVKNGKIVVVIGEPAALTGGATSSCSSSTTSNVSEQPVMK